MTAVRAGVLALVALSLLLYIWHLTTNTRSHTDAVLDTIPRSHQEQLLEAIQEESAKEQPGPPAQAEEPRAQVGSSVASVHGEATASRDAPAGEPAGDLPPAAEGQDGGERQGILPTVLQLGTSKGGSTFLFACIIDAFSPRVVCGSDDPKDWTGHQCAGRRFLLSALRMRVFRHPHTNRTVIARHRIKENYVLSKAMYHGPTSAARRKAYYRGPRLPLDLWSDGAFERLTKPGATMGRSTAAAQIAAEERCAVDITETLIRACAEHAGNPAEGCPLMQPKGSGAHRWRTSDKRIGEACGFRPPGKTSPGILPFALVERRCGHAEGTSPLRDYMFSDLRAFPPDMSADAASDMAAAALTKRMVGIDATPYYLPESGAPGILASLVPQAEALRFIVLVRNPVKRSYSEWSMAQSWSGPYHRSHSFERAVSQQLGQLRSCLGKVRIRDFVAGIVSDAVFAAAYPKCIRATYYHYVSNSLYGIHMRNWLRVFSPGQFLVVETELMKRLTARALLPAIAEHAGLTLSWEHMPEAIINTCQATGLKQLPNHKSKDEPLDEQTALRLAHLFFHGNPPVLNMVLPPQLRARLADGVNHSDATSLRRAACEHVRCLPLAG